MAGALIGLIGVIVGALLGGLLTFGVEASKRRKTAYAAGSLIATELTVVIDRMKSAIPESGTPERWVGDLPTKAWDARAADLVANGIPGQLPGSPEPLDPSIKKILDECEPTGPDLSHAQAQTATTMQPSQSPAAGRPDLLTKLGAVYASIDRWNTKTEHPEKCALARDIQFYSTARGDLRRYTRSLTSPRRASFRRVSSLAIAAAVVIVAAALLAVPRVDVNTVTVGVALQNHLGSTHVVHCDRTGVKDWQCIDYQLSKPLSACRTGTAADDTVTRRVVELAVERGACAEIAPPVPYGVQDDGSQLMVVRETPATARKSATDRELQSAASSYGIPEPAAPPWKRFLSWLGGH